MVSGMSNQFLHSAHVSIDGKEKGGRPGDLQAITEPELRIIGCSLARDLAVIHEGELKGAGSFLGKLDMSPYPAKLMGFPF